MQTGMENPKGFVLFLLVLLSLSGAGLIYWDVTMSPSPEGVEIVITQTPPDTLPTVKDTIKMAEYKHVRNRP